MKCPVCEAEVKDTDTECSCGELLTSWMKVRRNGHALRQRGLVLAGQEDYLGAALVFFEAALTNPFDDKSLIDTARALVPLGRTEDALRLLGHAASRPSSRASATAVSRAIQQLAERARTAEARSAEAEDESDPPIDTVPSPTNGEAAPLPVSVAIPVPEVAPAPTAQPPPPLLALGLRPCETTWLGFWRRPQTVDSLWTQVLRLEADGDRDWRAQVPWLEDVLQGCEGQAAFHYVLGLGAWQRNDIATARRQFAKSVTSDPPVLNPLAYHLVLHLDDPERGPEALRRLRELASPQKVDQLLEAVGERLARWLDPVPLQTLRTLLAVETSDHR